MIIGNEYKGCRYWGYEVASRVGMHGTMSPEERTAQRAKIKADADAVKAAGFRAQNMGYPNRGTAERVARDIEEKSGVEMHVFNHDYL